MEEPPVRHMDKDVTSSFVHTPGVPLALSMYAQCPGDRFRTEEPLSSFQTSNNQCGIEESPIEAQPTPSTKSKKITKTFSRKDTDELPEIAVNEECDIMSSLNGKLFSLMEDKNDKVIKMKYVSVTKKKNVPREPEKDVSVTKEREDITAAKKISVTKEEDFSVTKEEYLSASNDEGLSMTKEEDLSVTKKENISVTKEEDLSVTMTKEYLSMTKEEDPSVTKQRECVSAATKGRNDSGKKEKAVSLTEEGGVSRTTPGENVSTTNKKAASVITKANCSMTVMKVDSKNEDEESGAFFSTTKGGNWLLRPFVSLWEEKHFRLALKTEETRNEMKELSSGVGSIMDTINEDNFEDLADEMKELPVTSYVMLSFVCTIFFDRTITERHRMEVFARLCKVMSGLKVPRPPDNDSIKENMCTFRVIVLTKCQKQFEADRSFFADPDTMRRVVEAKFPREDVPNPDEAIETIVDECVLRRKQFHGNVRFIGHLFRLGMLTESIMHDSMYRLLKWRDDDGLKALGNLLSNVGSNLDTDKAKPRMNQYFQLITSLLSKISKPSVRFALRNVIELRQNNWKYRTDGRKIEPPEDDQKVYHAYESNWRYRKEGSNIETTEDDQDELKFRSKSKQNICTNDANADNETISRENLCTNDANAGIGTSS